MVNSVKQINNYYADKLSVEDCLAFLNDYSKKADGFIIYGCMQTGVRIKDILEKNNFKILGFLDDYWKEDVYVGYKVFHSANEAAETYINPCFTISSHLGNRQKIMIDKLKKGYNKDVEVLDKDVLFYINHGKSLDRNDGVILNKVDFIITNCCTLKCRDCCTLTPYVSKENRAHISFESVKNDVLALSKASDGVINFDIIGGEPLLFPKLEELIRFVHGLPNIYQIMVDTNGTIVPKQSLLNAMRECEVIVHITDYGEVSFAKEKVLKAFNDAGIIVSMRSASLFSWYDFGKIEERAEGEQYRWDNCNSRDCITMYKGRLHLCARDPRYVENGLYCADDTESVDLTVTDEEKLRFMMKKVIDRKNALTGCRFCGGAIDIINDGTQGCQLTK